MSLRETIEGARREAEGNMVGRPTAKKSDDEKAKPEDEKRGFSRKRAANAKPAREAASSVRTASKPSSKVALGQETKEEKRERRRKEREQEDLRNQAYDVVMRSIPGYKKTEKIFWICLGAGLALAVVSIITGTVMEGQNDFTTPQGIASVVSLVAAYACIIGGFIYDLVKRRPFRREAEARMKGLSDKKIAELVMADAVKREAERAAKKDK